jgi:hypothetical protein
MKKNYVFLSSLVLCLCFVTPVFGASSDASVILRTLIGNDTEAPSTPASVVATPMATTQIDITWASSTDDTGVSGYQLYRDAVLITTTSLLSYSDTGLSASTTYTYTVRAFDSFSNFSSSSVPVATTTFPLPPPPAPTPVATSSGESNTSTRVPVTLTSFMLTPSANGARVTFEASAPVQFLLRYGEKSVFDGNVIKNEVFARSHETMMSGLVPGTRYEYELYAYDQFGREVLLKRDTFRTDPVPDTNAPANVAFFSAQAIETDVFLNWTMPTEDDFSHIRIVRSHLFFPLDPNDGVVVFEGRATSFQDIGALVRHGTQYYTIFSYDTTGNRSSGAIAVAEVREGEIEPPLPPAVATSSATSTVVATIESVMIMQAGKVVPAKGGMFLIDPSHTFTIKIPYELFPQQLKVITVSLVHPTEPNKVFSFLLRANADFTYYEATLASLFQAGEYPVSFRVFNVFTNEISSFAGVIQATSTLEKSGAPVTYRDTRTELVRILFLAFVVVGALLLFRYLLFFKRREDNETVEK